MGRKKPKKVRTPKPKKTRPCRTTGCDRAAAPRRRRCAECQAEIDRPKFAVGRIVTTRSPVRVRYRHPQPGLTGVTLLPHTEWVVIDVEVMGRGRPAYTIRPRVGLTAKIVRREGRLMDMPAANEREAARAG